MHAFVVDYALVTGSLAGIKRVLVAWARQYTSWRYTSWRYTN